MCFSDLNLRTGRVNASILATARLDNLNASSEAMLASGYQHTWDILARTGALERNVTSSDTRLHSAEANIVRYVLCHGGLVVQVNACSEAAVAAPHDCTPAPGSFLPCVLLLP